MSVGCWAPTCGLDQLKARANLYARIRLFFEQRGVMEVSTPVLTQEAASDVFIESFETTSPTNTTKRFLQTSPEYAMKRLLAANAGPIYQIAPCFRQSESGRRHNPEFTLLEWYRPAFSLQDLIAELIDFLHVCWPGDFVLIQTTYGDLFEQHVGLNPHAADVDALQMFAEGIGLDDAPHICGKELSHWLDYLFSEIVQPQMQPNTVYCVDDYPACQAMLSRVKPGHPAVAERFEIFLNGVELANGFRELSDAKEQRRRFETDQARRKSLGLAPIPIPERLLQALEHGLPDSSGVALGLDRLLMLISGVDHIDQVINFPFDRA